MIKRDDDAEKMAAAMDLTHQLAKVVNSNTRKNMHSRDDYKFMILTMSSLQAVWIHSIFGDNASLNTRKALITAIAESTENFIDYLIKNVAISNKD